MATINHDGGVTLGILMDSHGEAHQEKYSGMTAIVSNRKKVNFKLEIVKCGVKFHTFFCQSLVVIKFELFILKFKIGD